MFTRITKKEEFIQNPILEMDEEQIANSPTDNIILFGKTYKMYTDEWKHHVHIKCTDMCDANCSFCIEKVSRNNPQNKENLLKSTEELLSQLAAQGQLQTVSITGGEPTIFNQIEQLINLISSFDLKLFSINTNGRGIFNIPENFKGWVNISKHAIDDHEVYKRNFNIQDQDIVMFKHLHPQAKVRFQCVLGTSTKMETLGNVFDYIIKYRDIVDDFSFRNLIIEREEDKISDLLIDFRNILFEHGDFIEQVIQDYYVYEVYNFLGTQITLSWSNMKKLKEYNEAYSLNFLEEIIVHPDGMITGSWDKKTLIIYSPIDRKNDYFLPCLGIGCQNPCKRLTTTSSPFSIGVVDDCSIFNC